MPVVIVYILSIYPLAAAVLTRVLRVLVWHCRMRRNQLRHVRGMHTMLSQRVLGGVLGAGRGNVQVMRGRVHYRAVCRRLRGRDAGDVCGVQNVSAGTVFGWWVAYLWVLTSVVCEFVISNKRIMCYTPPHVYGSYTLFRKIFSLFHA